MIDLGETHLGVILNLRLERDRWYVRMWRDLPRIQLKPGSDIDQVQTIQMQLMNVLMYELQHH